MTVSSLFWFFLRTRRRETNAEDEFLCMRRRDGCTTSLEDWFNCISSLRRSCSLEMVLKWRFRDVLIVEFSSAPPVEK
ncbi:hypothetical protein TorRG33x02_256770 [Trema orientale]|uniref:Uncharacterized protein n=1 Tax=Trema orientale TaxID=63057 RepID=A0A2P5DB62_TREOI|nr:hypothetical protein TorRG33x02_256770 [Trema orientale]